MEIKIPNLLRIKPNALFKLGKYVRQEGFQNIAIFWGEGVKDIFNEKVEVSFASAEVKVLSEEVVTTNNINDAFDSGKNLPFKVEAVLAIGGGKAVDYCKYVAFSKQIPMIAVPTLISNDAFASPVSSLTVDGARKSIKTTVPHGVIIDTNIIHSAPKHFIYSGIGDLFSKTTAIFDWKLAYKKSGEFVNDFASTIAAKAVDTFTYYKPKDLDDLEYIGVIASSLLMTGISMIVAGSSRPASGSEHLISHAYDRIAKKPSLHGLQVGVASYCVAYLQEATFERLKQDIVESGFYEYMKQNPLDKEDFIKAIMLAPEIKENYFTILSERGNLSRLEKFVREDEMMKDMVV